VIKHRRKIASLFARLDMSPIARRGALLAKGQGHRANGNGHSLHPTTPAKEIPLAVAAMPQFNGHGTNGHSTNGHSANGYSEASLAAAG
jgi:hypothetical protein